MTRKKPIEAVSVSTPKSSASVPAVKKPRAKTVKVSAPSTPEKTELVTKPVHKRRTAPEAVAPAIPTSKTSISNLVDAVGMNSALNQEEIAIHAYLCWLERGCPHGTSTEDWFRAESELRNQSAAVPVLNKLAAHA